MNINLEQFTEEIDESREIVSRGVVALDPNLTILIQDPDYRSAYQVWFTTLNHQAFIHVTPDGEVLATPSIEPFNPTGHPVGTADPI